jgi:hypothetical protein
MPSIDPELVRGFVRGEISEADLRSHGIPFDFADGLYRGPPIEQSCMVTMSDFARGIVHYAGHHDQETCMSWSYVVMNSDHIDFDDESPYFDEVFDTLWDMAFKNLLSQERLAVITRLAKDGSDE